jgi:phage terminase large subunit-like protein
VTVPGMLDIVEDDTYRFDADAADRPVRFVEKLCRHYEGRFAGHPFILHPVQRKLVRDIYGWKHRVTGFRRFTDVWLEASVGAGKSPLLAALGLYGLMADGEQGAQVYSLASSYGQARVVFECAKRFVDASDSLAARLTVRQYEIGHPASGSFWRIISGKGPGAGCRPSLVLGDEVHEWAGPGAYQSLKDRMLKRSQPLMILATNAGTSRASLCYQLHERAAAALAGTGERTLYPVLWAAPEGAKAEDPAAWRAANPLIGVTIDPDKVAEKAAQAAGDPSAEAEFARLYLSRWPKGGGDRWLDLTKWDAAAGTVDPVALKECALFVGLDLSLGDDLCAAAFVYAGPERYHLDAHFWLPRETAERYEAKDGIPYAAWAAAGAITLLDEPTIGPAARKMIAAHVTELHKRHPVKAVCYDRYKADETVAALESAGITAVPVPQGWSLSPGCMELDRRLKAGTITVTENPVMRFCVENTQVKGDDRGNIWPSKPNALGKYAGRRGLKIDGVTAAATALTEARKFAFPTAKKQWRGTVQLV